MAILEQYGKTLLTGILPSEIEDKKRRTNIGDLVKVKGWRECEGGEYKTATIEGIVLAKYKHIVVTTAGDFQWAQFLMENPKAR